MGNARVEVTGFGLRQSDLVFMENVFARFPEIEKVLLYSSRATGKYRSGSDVDLALIGDGIGYVIVSRVRSLLDEETPMPLFVDVLHLNETTDEKLRTEILRFGKVIYER